MIAGIKLALLLLVALVLQLTVFTDVRIAGVAPELLALVGVLSGVVAGPDRGPVVAFMAGLLWDVYLPTPLGVAAICFALVAFSVGSVEASLFGDSRLQLSLLVAVATTATVIAYALLSEVVGERGLVDLDLLRVAAISGVANALLAPLLAPLVRWSFGAPKVVAPT